MDHQSQLIADVASATARQRSTRAAFNVAEAEAEKASDELRHAWSKLRCWQDEQVEAALGAIVGAPADPEAFG
jgi:hypothetical protein